jgi:hypothetical protein
MNEQIVIYESQDGITKIDVQLQGETVWLSLDQMAELFQRNKSTVSRHISNIFKEGDLERDSVVAKNATTAADGMMPINNNALAAITLMIALSKPEGKEVMCLLVMNKVDAIE